MLKVSLYLVYIDKVLDLMYNLERRCSVAKKLVLYHGTDIVSARSIVDDGINLNKSKRSVDFGRGLYLTENPFYASDWAIKKVRPGQKPSLVKIEYDIDAASNYCTIKHFHTTDLKWGQFIVNNRCGFEYIKGITNKDNNIGAQYDIVIGRIADGPVVQIVRDLQYKKVELSTAQLNAMLQKDYGYQYLLHTDAAITFVITKEIVPLRRTI